jgi:hypothetical protein
MTGHHLPNTECHACCRLVHPQHLSNNECSHLLWCPHSILGNQCNCRCSMIHTEVHPSCSNRLVKSRSWAARTWTLVQPARVSSSVLSVLSRPRQTQVLVVARRQGKAHGSLLAAEPYSNKLHSRGHQRSCKQCLACCMVGHLETLCNSPNTCHHQGDPHTSPGNWNRCLLHSMTHRLGCHTGPLVAVGCSRCAHHHTAARPVVSAHNHSDRR